MHHKVNKLSLTLSLSLGGKCVRNATGKAFFDASFTLPAKAAWGAKSCVHSITIGVGVVVAVVWVSPTYMVRPANTVTVTVCLPDTRFKQQRGLNKIFHYHGKSKQMHGKFSVQQLTATTTTTIVEV